MSIHQHSQHALPSASAACWPVPKTTRPRCERSQLHFAWDVLLRFTQVGCLDDVICRKARRLVESNEFISTACSVLSLPSTRLCCAFSSLLPLLPLFNPTDQSAHRLVLLPSEPAIELPVGFSISLFNHSSNCPSRDAPSLFSAGVHHPHILSTRQTTLSDSPSIRLSTNADQLYIIRNKDVCITSTKKTQYSLINSRTP